MSHRLGQLANSVIARLALGDWDEALAEQARLRELFGEAATRPPSFASGGYGAEALIHELRGDQAAADAVLDEIDGWEAGGERPRLWASPLAAIAVARRGDYERAHAYLAQLVGKHGIYLARELEARCTLIAEEGDWSEAAALITRARRHAGVARLLALAVHADRLEGRAFLASGDAEAACVCLERAVAGFHELGAAWERAVTELALGEAFAALGRDADAASRRRAPWPCSSACACHASRRARGSSSAARRHLLRDAESVQPTGHGGGDRRQIRLQAVVAPHDDDLTQRAARAACRTGRARPARRAPARSPPRARAAGSAPARRPRGAVAAAGTRGRARRRRRVAAAVRQATRAPEERPPMTSGRPRSSPARRCSTTAIQAGVELLRRGGRAPAGDAVGLLDERDA